jgi:hypothetical protein
VIFPKKSSENKKLQFLPQNLIKTRLKISSVLNRIQKAISICTPSSKSQCNVLLTAGKACNKLPAYGRKKASNPAGLRPVIKTVGSKAAGQGCRARLHCMARVQYAPLSWWKFKLVWTIARAAHCTACMQFGILLLQFGILPLQFGILPQQFGILPLQFDILPLQFGILPLQFGILPLHFD